MADPNPMKGETEVELADGRKLKLVFNANAWIAAEDELGKSTPEIIAELQSGKASLKTQRAVMYGGLRKYHPEVGLEEAGDILLEAAGEMAKALSGGLPQGEEEPPSEFDDEEAGSEAEPGPSVAAGAGTAN